MRKSHLSKEVRFDIVKSAESDDRLLSEALENAFPEVIVLDDPEMASNVSNRKTLLDYNLLRESIVSLLFSTFGLIGAGFLLDRVQHYDVFVEISELIILIPVLLNLKGNLELNLSARLSTASNLGKLDDPEKTPLILMGNLMIMQLQGMVVGFTAGVFAVYLGYILHHSSNSPFQIILTLSASIWTASLSSVILGSFMCGVVLVSRWMKVNPDNVMAPLAASTGDVLSMAVLLGVSTLFHQLDVATILFSTFLLVSLLPFVIRAVAHNDEVKGLLYDGWTPLFISMIVSSMSGIVLERYLDMYQAMAFIAPVINGIVGNLSAIYASRIATSYHSNKDEDLSPVVRSLLLVNCPIQLLFVAIMAVLHEGHVTLTPAFVTLLLTGSYLVTFILLKLTKIICSELWKRNYNPHNYALPYITSIGDLLGTSTLALIFMIIE